MHPRRRFIPAAVLVALAVVPAALKAQKPVPISVSGPAAPATGYIPSINARITSLRFYEGPRDGVNSDQRLYRTTFARAVTRFVYWQLDVSFPTVGGQVTVPMDAVWYRQDGSVFARQTDGTMRVQSGWSSAAYTRGRGWSDYGNWPTGPYYLDVFAEGSRVAAGVFTVDDGQGVPIIMSPPGRPVSPYITAFNARVTSVRFFESGRDIPRAADRAFQSSFPRSSTRYVNWQLDLTYPSLPRTTNFSVEAVWYAPDGSVFARQSSGDYSVQSGWTSSDHSWGRGWEEPGHFNAGTYYVEIFVNGSRIGYDRFVIRS